MTLRPKLRRLLREDLRAWSIAGLVVAAGVLHLQWHRVTDSRVWRDLTGVTPFSDVRVLSVSATALEIVLSGTLVKDRDCSAFGSAVAYVMVSGVALPAAFSVREGPAVPPSRPPGPDPQAWVPWVITSPVAWPDRARVYRTHVCAGEYQTNLVLDVAWPRTSDGHA